MLEITKPNFPLKVTRTEYDIYTFYFLNDRKRSMDGKITYGKLPCRFKKDVELEDNTEIFIQKAYLDWYKKGRESKLQVFVTEFEIVNQRGKEKKKAISEFAESDEFDFDLEEFEF